MLGCQSFAFDKHVKQRLVECEMEMFRDEVERMVEKGFRMKCIWNRLRGEVWGIHETQEREERLRLRRLLGADVR